MEEASLRSRVPFSNFLRMALIEGFQREAMAPDFLEGFQKTPLKSVGLTAQDLHLCVAEEPHADIGAMEPGERTPFFTQVPA